MSQRRAAIDIGTVSTRLLVADVDGDDLTEIVRHTRLTHLGEGLATSGRLSPEGTERVLAEVSGFMAECADLNVERIGAVATSAVRDATDGAEFVERVGALGVTPEVVSGTREAHLSFRGATWGFCSADPLLVCDLGGGSTELVTGVTCDDGSQDGPLVDIESARSIDCGSRRVTDMFLASDPPAAGELEAARVWVTEQFRPYFDALDSRPRVVLALAGTATTLAAVAKGLVEYDPAEVHGSELSGGDLADLREELAALTLAERRKVPGLEPGRASVIVAGALILETVLALSGLDAVTVSEHDILYGIVLEEA
jgi:exopolyphosphatase / guanosine-5'-triphosphate,3'-diphosphate pyrophosphatase